MSASKTESTKQQIDKIIHQEIAALSDIDQIAKADELQQKLSAFIDSLQGQFNSLIEETRKDAEAKLKQKAEQAEQGMQSSTSSEHATEKAARVIADLEAEFRTYNIKQSNGIGKQEHSKKHVLVQSLIGTAIAVVALWFFWPASDAGQELQAEQIAVEEIAEQNAATAAEEQPVAEAAKQSVVVINEHADAATKAEKVAAPASTAEQQFVELVTVTAHVGNVRNAPDNSGERISRVKKGEVVSKLGEEQGWFRVKLDNGKIGWIYSSVFAPRLQINVDVANIRSEPANSGKIVTRLNKGDFVTKVGEDKGWYQVKMDSGKTAWAHQSLF